jgi:hypothetical protein
VQDKLSICFILSCFNAAPASKLHKFFIQGVEKKSHILRTVLIKTKKSLINMALIINIFKDTIDEGGVKQTT